MQYDTNNMFYEEKKKCDIIFINCSIFLYMKNIITHTLILIHCDIDDIGF
jgi:hypothetical protein